MDDYLFNSGDLRGALEHQRRAMMEAIASEPEAEFLQTDADAWAEALAHHFAAECPMLDREATSLDPVQGTTVDVSRDWDRAIIDPNSPKARKFPGYRVVVRTPFQGDAAVFRLTPGEHTLNPPRGRVAGQDILLTIEYAQDREPDIDGLADGFLNNVSQWLGFARNDIGGHNSMLRSEARQAIEARRQRIAKRDENLAKSKYPVRDPDADRTKTYIADAVVRRPAPSLPRNHADRQAPRLEPALAEEVFDHILGVIRMQATQMERSPRTYAGMGEEDRRQTILATLNTHYGGRATAEAFNGAGKTDILIRHEGRNIFVAECKFWNGPKGFQATIDQVYSYASWRDAKVVIVMFVRERGLSEILAKAEEALGKHPLFVRQDAAADETELRATMHWPGDPDRVSSLNVFFVHIPE